MTPEEAYQAGKLSMPEIIRCRDCKFLSSPPGSDRFCEHIRIFIDLDWFCADGKRRDYVEPVPGSVTDWDGIECK